MDEVPQYGHKALKCLQRVQMYSVLKPAPEAANALLCPCNTLNLVNTYHWASQVHYNETDFDKVCVYFFFALLLFLYCSQYCFYTVPNLRK